jgi:YXWGXW repeat-containing protein
MNPKPSFRMCLPAATAFAAFLSTACVVAPPPGVVYVRTRPPVDFVEVRGVAPGPEFVWISGYHTWRGDAYVWVPGRWAARPHPHAVWLAGVWRHHRNGWYWVEGHWR